MGRCLEEYRREMRVEQQGFGIKDSSVGMWTMIAVSDIIRYVRLGQQKIAAVEESDEHNKTAGAESKVFQEGTNNRAES